MGWSPRAGVSFCFVADRVLFLDVPNDRYFCLNVDTEASFRRLCTGQALPTDTDRLRHAALVVASDDESVPAPCSAPDRSGESLLDRRLEPPDVIDVTRAYATLAVTATHLRYAGLAAALKRVERRSAGHRGTSPPPLVIERIVAAFVATRAWFNEHDRCLLRSLAIAHRLAAIGATPTVVLAVKLQPFGAHCWVQLGDRLVNDRIDIVRHYTPILAI